MVSLHFEVSSPLPEGAQDGPILYGKVRLYQLRENHELALPSHIILTISHYKVLEVARNIMWEAGRSLKALVRHVPIFCFVQSSVKCIILYQTKALVHLQ